MTDPVRKKMTLSDGDVSYLDWPADAPLLHFTHATGFNAETYRGLLTPLQGRFHVAAADMRGHGFTTLDRRARAAGRLDDTSPPIWPRSWTRSTRVRPSWPAIRWAPSPA